MKILIFGGGFSTNLFGESCAKSVTAMPRLEVALRLAVTVLPALRAA